MFSTGSITNIYVYTYEVPTNNEIYTAAYATILSK